MMESSRQFLVFYCVHIWEKCVHCIRNGNGQGCSGGVYTDQFGKLPKMFCACVRVSVGIKVLILW